MRFTRSWTSLATTQIMAFVLALTAVSVLPAIAADKMTAREIKSAVAGKTVLVSNPVGSIPIHFRSNGTMRAKATTLAKLTGVKADHGRWWVSGTKLCQKWSTWLKGKTHCVTLHRKGSKYVWRNGSGKSGSASVSSR